jgi:hypothetical protein
VKITVRTPGEYPRVTVNVPAQRVAFDDDGLRIGAGTETEISIVEFTMDEARAILRTLREVMGERQ